ncbi:hypothetical protein PIB30_082149 [Stylosanthes scabra]|uniref:Uncharacterized protein n=1 Tax=Stylosanthes scabra TaxID=79078 RepID=A0ABU6SS77_9FABA|nr:hypothetical protein [Stylosanthes scabra]
MIGNQTRTDTIVLEFGISAEIFPGGTSQSASSSCTETRTVNLINGTGLMPSGMKRSENEGSCRSKNVLARARAMSYHPCISMKVWYMLVEAKEAVDGAIASLRMH